jgi:16S rRNA (cytidine1402-2'-O)-methyltransferase
MKEGKAERSLFLIPNLLANGTAKAVLPPLILKTVKETEFYFVEDPRSARRFLSELKVGLEIGKLHFYKVDKDTKAEEVIGYFNEIPSDKNAGVISEAGCPCIADPGSVAVSIAHKEGWKVVPLVGPSSILLALIASGFNGQSFAFHGYLPIEREARANAIKSLEKESSNKRQTQIFIEPPYRNNNLLEDLLKICHPTTKICVAVNLTSEDERIIVRTVKEWKKDIPDLHKKPAVFVLSASNH